MYIVTTNSIRNIIKNIGVAAIIFVAILYAIFTSSHDVYGQDIYDDEVIFSDRKKEEVKLPKGINWEEKTYEEEIDGKHMRFVLEDKIASVYVDGKMIWHSDDSYFVQDMFVADIDEGVKYDGINKNVNADKELVLLLWKEGRYGVHKPFWVGDDEKDFSQHLFTYNIFDDKVKSKWGSSFMGEVAKEMSFKNGILFIKTETNVESAWKWYSFGFEKLNDVKILVAGDNLIHEPIYIDAIKNHNGEFKYLYEKIGKEIAKSDLAVINLETPLVYDPANYSTYPCFGSPVNVAKGIKDIGFDAVTLSNNHRLDKGKKGVEETLKALDENKLIHVGSMDEKPYVLVKRNEIEFALMNYTYGTNGIRPPAGYENCVNYLDNPDKIREDIREAKKNSDVVLMFVHWGNEYQTEPSKSQITWRNLFYEEGVDAVIGTHPHVIQKYEIYEGEDKDTNENNHKMLVYYSLGNYISANQRKDHNSGGIGSFSVKLTSDGIKIYGEKFHRIDTMYSYTKY